MGIAAANRKRGAGKQRPKRRTQKSTEQNEQQLYEIQLQARKDHLAKKTAEQQRKKLKKLEKEATEQKQQDRLKEINKQKLECLSCHLMHMPCRCVRQYQMQQCFFVLHRLYGKAFSEKTHI